MVVEDESQYTANSSGYSSYASSGNVSPEVNIGSRSTTTDVSQSRFAEFQEQISRSLMPSENISSEQVNVPESLKVTCRDLAEDIAHYVAGTRKRKPPSKHAETLRRTTEEMFTRHEIFFNKIANMQIDKNTANSCFTNVADEMLSDGVINWGRIVSLFAFGARLAQHCHVTSSDKSDRTVSSIGSYVGNYIADRLGVWICANGGWDAFDEHFPSETRLEDTIRKGLFMTALGLGALATLVLAR